MYRANNYLYLIKKNVMENSHSLPVLTAEEVRVLGALMEKGKVTPDSYPLTLNSTLLACNQKTSRYPVVEYDEETVSIALDGLKRKGFVSPDTGGGSRANKYKHNFHLMFQLPRGAQAAMTLLFLRGPLTAGEINSSSGRLYDFSSLDEVYDTLNALMEYELPLVSELERRPGQKERRFAHRLSGEVTAPFDEETASPVSAPKKSAIEERLQKVEDELAEVKTKLEGLIQELKG